MNKEVGKDIMASNQKLQTMLTEQKCANVMDTWSALQRGKLLEFIIGSERSFERLIPIFWSKICEPEKNILQEIKMILENRKSILTDPNYCYQAMLLLKGAFDFIKGEKDLLGNDLQTKYENEENLTVKALENVETRLKDDFEHLLLTCEKDEELKEKVQKVFNHSEIGDTKEVAYQTAIKKTGSYLYGQAEQLAAMKKLYAALVPLVEMKKLSHQEEDNYVDKFVTEILDNFPLYSEKDGKYLF